MSKKSNKDTELELDSRKALESQEEATLILHQTLAAFQMVADKEFWAYYYNIKWFYDIVNALVVMSAENERLASRAYPQSRK